MIGLLWLPDTACKTEVEALLDFLSSLSWKTFRPSRTDGCGTLLCLRAGDTLRAGFGGCKVAFGFGETRSSKDIERPLLALRGRLLCMLARKECRWLISGLTFRASDALRGLAERSTLEKFHLGLTLPVEIPSPTGECGPMGVVKLIEVKSVSACENAREADPPSTDVSPLSRLMPDTRCGLRSILDCPSLLAGSSIGSGGTGTSGACPGC